jgi:hypothetical protein
MCYRYFSPMVSSLLSAYHELTWTWVWPDSFVYFLFLSFKLYECKFRFISMKCWVSFRKLHSYSSNSVLLNSTLPCVRSSQVCTAKQNKLMLLMESSSYALQEWSHRNSEWCFLCFLMWLCKIWGFHCSDYEEWRLLGCYAMWLL